MEKDITIDEYKVYGADLKEHYSEILKEKEEQLELEKNKKEEARKKVCRAYAEWELFTALEGYEKGEQLIDKFHQLKDEYESMDNSLIEKLEKEIAWLKEKIS